MNIFFHFLHCSYENLLKAYVAFGHAGIVCLRVKLMMKNARQRLTKIKPYFKCQLNISRHIICNKSMVPATNAGIHACFPSNDNRLH